MSHRGANPSPVATDLFLVDGRIIDEDGDVLVDARGAHRWSTDGSTVYRTRDWRGPGDGYGGDCAAGTGGLLPRFEEPPFAEVLELAAVADGVVLHKSPDGMSPSVGSMSANDLAIVTNVGAVEAAQELCNGSSKCSLTRDVTSPSEWWIHVQLPSGDEGWARAASVDWREP